MFVILIYLVVVGLVTVSFPLAHRLHRLFRDGNVRQTVSPFFPATSSSPSAEEADPLPSDSQQHTPRPSSTSSQVLATVTGPIAIVKTALPIPGPVVESPAGSHSSIISPQLFSTKPTIATLVILLVHPAVILAISFVYRAQLFVVGCYVCYPFVVLDIVAFLMFLRYARSQANEHKSKATQAMGLAAVWLGVFVALFWPFTLSILDPASLLRGNFHFWGLAVWGLMVSIVFPQTMEAMHNRKAFGWRLLNYPHSAVCFLFGLALMASAVFHVNWSHLSPSQDDWYLLCHLMVPLTILWAFGDSSTRNTFNQTTPYSVPVADPSQAQHHLHLSEDKSLPVCITDTRVSMRSLPIHLCSASRAIPPPPPPPPHPAMNSCVANLAHEIRTPLNALLSCCTLLGDTPLSPDQLEYVSIMMTCGSQITNNINFVLDVAKIEQGKLVLEHKPLDLCEVSRDCLRVVRHLAEQKRLKLELRHCRDGDPTIAVGEGLRPVSIFGDVSRLRQMMLNLLTNSIKFTHEGGVSITLIEPSATSSPYSVPLDIAAPTLRIEISDTGIGMSEEQQKRLFQPYEQASRPMASMVGLDLGW